MLNTSSYVPGVVNVPDTTDVPVVANVPIPTRAVELVTMVDTVHVEFIVVSCQLVPPGDVDGVTLVSVYYPSA